MYTAEEVANKINEKLKDKQISQKEMLEACDLSKNTISSMLSRGSMLRADNLARIAEYLQCSVDYLLGVQLTNNHPQNLSQKELEILKKFHQLSSDGKNNASKYIDYLLFQEEQKRKETLSPSANPEDNARLA